MCSVHLCAFTTFDLDHKLATANRVVNFRPRSPKLREKTKPAARRGSSWHFQSVKHPSVVDKKSGQSYLVDTGAEVSVYPASLHDRQTPHPSTTLSAANGTSIRTWGKRSISLALGPKRHYTHEFYIADVMRPILGADFFTAHELAIDLRGRRLKSLDNISILLQDTKPPLTLAGLGLPHQNRYSGLL